MARLKKTEKPRTEEERKAWQHEYYLRVTKVKRQNNKPIYTKTCVICGKTFTTTRNRIVVCSDECRKIRFRQGLAKYQKSERFKELRKQDRLLLRQIKAQLKLQSK